MEINAACRIPCNLEMLRNVRVKCGGGVMLSARRDYLVGPSRNAMPCLGEIEGRILVLETIALTALPALYRAHKGERRRVLAKIRRAIKNRCKDAKLGMSDINAATCYAVELLEAAEEQLDKEEVSGNRQRKALESCADADA
ncbi:hypothetical protein QD460_31300 [Rhizobium jaguaris]|uniref:hypothetical protein n=1 Tax=Rhizobium jaguaris TaxID=1312183 RepID=UPI0039BFA939